MVFIGRSTESGGRVERKSKRWDENRRCELSAKPSTWGQEEALTSTKTQFQNFCLQNIPKGI